MGVVKEERDCLDRVLHRYQATGTADAALAQVEGMWQSALGDAWSSVSSTCASGRRLVVNEAIGSPDSVQLPTPLPEPRRPPVTLKSVALPPEAAPRYRFRVVPERSVVLIEARSTVGPIRFGAMGLTGTIEVELRDGELCCESRPSAQLVIPVDQLRSGNGLYDAEVLRRIDARRFPRVVLNLEECAPIGTRATVSAWLEGWTSTGSPGPSWVP